MEVSVRIFYPEPPAHAEAAPGRAVYVGDAQGRCEVFAWDVARGTRRRITDRPQGTVACAIEPSGERVWWFDDDMSGVGQWRIQPFEGGAAEPSGPPAGRAAGLAMAADGTAAVGVGHVSSAAGETGTSIYLVGPDGDVRLVAGFPGYAQVADLSADAALLAVATDPDRADAVTVLDLSDGSAAVLSGTGDAVWATGFAPGGDPHRLLLTQAAADGYRLAVWEPGQGLTALGADVFDTEIAPSWFPDGDRILIRRDRHARSTLHVLDLRTRSLEDIETPAGTLLAATAQPGGDLHYVWTDSVHPPRLCTTSGRRPPEAEPEPPAAARQRDVWVPTPAGPVHTLVTLPETATAADRPRPAVFLLHGGPFDAARDAYDALVSVFVSIGCAVVRPNYRGSVGYGAAWRDDFGEGVGFTQLADLAAVRRHLVDTGLVDPERTAVCGQSWGGYLALLAAGAQPELWHAVAAVNPVADYPAAFHETTDAIRALDVRLFGGTPEELPEQYRRASPATYVAAVRAPVLVLAGADDPKCPPEQVRSYVKALRLTGAAARLEWTASGHEGFDTTVHVQTIASVVGFTATAMGGRPAPAGAAAG